MKRLDTLLFTFALLFYSYWATAQDFAVSGTVTNAATGEALIGATIQVKTKTTTGTVTDIDGNYSLRANPTDILVFSYVGFENLEIAIESRKQIAATLRESNSTLNDVVVVGYGVQKKSQLTGAIASISNKDFKDQPVSNLAGSIQGKVSGLNVTSPSGTPGAGLLVSVRGAINPLYVVDGVPLLSESNSALSTAYNIQGETQGSGQTLSSISDINPNDIESIEILKDASAAAIYGARAANGVVLITTKRGKEGKTETSFNYYTGIQKVSHPVQYLSDKQYVDLIEEGRKNDLAIYQKDNTAFGPDFDPSVLTSPLENFDLTKSPNTNWINTVTRAAPIHNYELSMRGGSNKTRFYTGAAYYDQQGIVIENYYKRLNYRLNIDHNVSEKFLIGATTSVTYSKNRRSFNDDTYTGVITNAMGCSPLMPAYDEKGNYARFEDYQTNWLSDNPLKSAKEIRAYTTGYRFLGTTFGEYALAKNLKLRSSWSADANFLYDEHFKSALTSDASVFGGQMFEAGFRSLTWLNENTLNYSLEKGKSTLNLLAGVTEQVTKIDHNSATGRGFTGGLERLSSAATIVAATSGGTSFALVSYLARVNYTLSDKYLFTASVRTDGSSRFSKTNRYGTFSSASFAWRLSKESFFATKKISDLKLRASYGLTGDQEIGNFENITFYGPGRYDGQAGIALRNLADPNLSWQQNKMLNLGLDYEILAGKFAGSIEFFKSNKNRLLSKDVILGTTGFPTVTRNSGEIENKGVEFNFNWAVVNRANFRWNMNFNTTYIKNKIISLSSDNTILAAFNDLAATHILRVGEPIGSFYGLKFTGVDAQTGDAKFEDTNKDGVIDYTDAQIIGKAIPTFTGGFTNVMNYKNIDISVFCRFSQGNSVYNLIRSTSDNLGYGNGGGLTSAYANNTVNVLSRWQKPGDVTNVPRASFLTPNYYNNSTMFLEDASFFRIQNVTIGYTFKNIKKISNLRIYAEGQNVFTFTKYKGFDPEVSSNGASSDRTTGVDFGAYPQARTVLVGANLKF